MSPARGGVAVVGSANIDRLSTVSGAPRSGETLLASAYAQGVGGKGYNQAVGAARTAPTALIAAVGSDADGHLLRESAKVRGVDVVGVRSVEMPTGQAFITLLPDGENVIIVAPLANQQLTPSMVVEELERVQPAVILLQFEIPLETVAAALIWASDAGVRAIVNPSPLAEIDAVILAVADPLIVNAGEAQSLVGYAGTTLELARGLAALCRSAIVTAGGEGACVADHAGAQHIPVVTQVTVRDSSGAGDEFAGTVAAALANGASLAEATRRAVEAATLIVTKSRHSRG
ncbi:MAG: ribokinase [Microbacteriaceae bacterium]